MILVIKLNLPVKYAGVLTASAGHSLSLGVLITGVSQLAGPAAARPGGCRLLAVTVSLSPARPGGPDRHCHGARRPGPGAAGPRVSPTPGPCGPGHSASDPRSHGHRDGQVAVPGRVAGPPVLELDRSRVISISKARAARPTRSSSESPWPGPRPLCTR
jgi:hypothetical protein